MKRILLKISGEALGGEEQPSSKSSFDIKSIENIVNGIETLYKNKVQIGIVLGGGNIFRGAQLPSIINASIRDYMGMLATIINGIMLREMLEKIGCQTKLITSFAIQGIGEIYDHHKCQQYLQNNMILLFAGGTGHPYFTTDTAAALRAVEIQAEYFLKATKVNGVYEKDPKLYQDAKKFDFLTYDQVITEKYRVMDLTAITFCRENQIPILVFDLFEENSLVRVVQGEKLGTLISNSACQ